MTDLERTTAGLLAILSVFLPTCVAAQADRIEAPSTYQQELDAGDPDSSFTDEADALDPRGGRGDRGDRGGAGPLPDAPATASKRSSSARENGLSCSRTRRCR